MFLLIKWLIIYLTNWSMLNHLKETFTYKKFVKNKVYITLLNTFLINSSIFKINTILFAL